MKFLTFVVILVLVSFGLKYSLLIIRRIGENNSFGKKIHNLEPMFTLIVWVIVAFWGVYFLFFEKPYYNFIVFSLIALVFVSVSWFFVRDFMAGVAFKMQNKYASGDIIQFGNISGKINELLITHVSIYTREGKLVKVPYSRLSSEIISQKSVSGSFDLNQYELKIPKKYDLVETQEIIKKMLFNSPWRISTKAPAVEFKSETSEEYQFEIQVETRNEQHFNQVIAHVKKHFELES